MTITTEGFGKKTDLKEYKAQKRGGMGIKNFKLSSKTGDVVSSILIDAEENKEIMLITKDGTLIRTSIEAISNYSRATSGVTIMKLRSEDYVKSFALAPESEEENE